MSTPKLSCAFLLLLLSSSTAQAERFVEAVGNAVINNEATMAARERAVKNAMEQAMMQTSANIASTSTVNANVLVIESTRIEATGAIADVQVLEEWQDMGIYFVRIRAKVPKNDIKPTNAASRYRKKIAALQFDVLKRTHVQDLGHIERDLPMELLRRLENLDMYIAVDATDILLTKQQLSADTIQQIAAQLDAQIIITGIIRDFSVQEEFFWKNRNTEIDIMVYDGLSGARLARHTLSELTRYTGYQNIRGNIFTNYSLMSKPLGKTLDRILTRQVELVHEDLLKVPFSAKVVDIQGTEIFFNAGTNSAVQTGDVLMAYRVEPEALKNLNQQSLGFREESMASITVKQVNTQFAAGELETDKIRLNRGDIIRFGW